MSNVATRPITTNQAGRKAVTCTACGLKKCVGRCHFERTGEPRPPKAV